MPRIALATLNHSPLHGLPTSMEAHLDAAKDAGFDGLAPDVFWLRALESEGTALEALADAMRERGLACTEIAGLAVGEDAATQSELEEILRYARLLGSEFVNARVVIPPDAGVRARMRRCATALADLGVRIALEFSNGTELKDLASARAFVEAADAPGLGLTLDTWHFCQAKGGPDWAGLEALPAAALANVQLSDGVAFEASDYREETMHRRCFAGSGTLDLDRCSRILRAKGFDGPIVVEVLSSALREWTLADFANEAAKSTRRWWAG